MRSCWILWFPGRVLSSLLLATGGIVFSFFEEGTDFYVILSLSCNPRAEASPNKAKKQTNMGKLHLAAERGNIEECQKLLTEVVRSMKDPLGHKR